LLFFFNGMPVSFSQDQPLEPQCLISIVNVGFGVDSQSIGWPEAGRAKWAQCFRARRIDVSTCLIAEADAMRPTCFFSCNAAQQDVFPGRSAPAFAAHLFGNSQFCICQPTFAVGFELR
jgi:hypothetical protein